MYVSGVGYVVMTLEHGTGTVRMGYDNVSPEQMVAMATRLRDAAQSLLGEARHEKRGEEVRQSLQGERTGA